jgi:hypothetical protein
VKPIQIIFITAILALSSLQLKAQTFVGVSSSPADNGTLNGPDAIIVPPVGMQSGDLVVVYGHYNNTISTTLSISYTAGQTWNVGGTQFGNNQNYFIAWCRFNGSWNGNPIVSVPAGNTNALTATMYVYRPTSNIVSWAVDQTQANSNSNTNPHSIAAVTNVGGNTVTMAFWCNTLTNTWGTLTGAGWSNAGISAQYRNNGIGLQGHTAAYRIAGSGSSGAVAQSQTPATTNTRKAIMSWRQISNDLCANAIPLFSGTTCVNTAGNVFGATNTAITYTGTAVCASGETYDLWYSFVAQTTNPTITLSSIGSAFTNPRLQLLQGSCGSMTSLFCGTTSINADYLTPGTTYFVRVYSTGVAPGSALNAGFNICVTDPVEPPPHNDNCSGAVNLPIWNTCNNVGGDMGGATLSTVSIAGANCATGATYDVWYRFVAVNTTATVTLSNIPSIQIHNFINRNVQILSGNCGSFTQLGCGVNTASVAGLVAGQTYYIRVYSTSTPIQNGNARFNICVTTTNAPIRYGNTYVNVTKRTTGGVVEPNDILEIRMTISHVQGIKSNIRFVDNIPTKTAIATTGSGHDSIWIRTNEGLTYKRYTLAAGDDAATYLASPGLGEYNIRMNLGFAGGALPNAPVNNTATESASANGIMNSSNNPRGGGGLLFAIAYRVRVTGVVGDTITLNAPQFIYRGQGGLGVDTTLTGTPYKIVISSPLTLCSNSTGVNNASEFGGTFGSGTNFNRGTDLTDPIDGYTFVGDVSAYTNLPDGRYAIVKNISPRSGTNRNAARNPAATCFPWAPTDPNSCNFRMFGGFWYIDGDHGGVSNGSAGTTPPGPTTNGSYMLLVNADFVASEIYRHTVTNLCPSTYYEFSAWVRNVCPTCGIDSTGNQFAGTVTAPANGYPGVLPNLSFLMNDVDVYNTGEIDTVGWIKKGFVFLTGPSQTSATFSIRNSAQGGGGNDWAIDDIAVATCLPGLTMRPNNTPTYCRNGSIDLSVAVSSFYNNYLYYRWERSTDGGLTWHSAPEMPGTQTFTYTNFGTDYRDTVAVPTFIATSAMNGYKYRIRTATILANLSNDNCSIYNSSDVITINIDPNCTPLNAEVFNFNIRLNNNKAQLTWDSRNEEGLLHYEVEKSKDGRNFSYVGTVTAKGSGSASYLFNDAEDISTKTYYRLKLVSNNTSTYSNILSVSNIKSALEITNLINPFDSKISFQLLTSATEEVQVQLLDALGHQIISRKLLANKGSNAIRLDLPVNLQRATYLLRVVSASGTINRIIQKH